MSTEDKSRESKDVVSFCLPGFRLTGWIYHQFMPCDRTLCDSWEL